jgi:RNA polymerase sigma-32 factor
MPLSHARSTNRRQPALSNLSRRSRPPLPREEEAQLARAYVQTRDPRIADVLVEANLRLVLKIAGEYAPPARSELADLVQEGSLGLVEAVRRYEPSRGTRLATYAGFWIRAFILRHILHSSRVVRPGRTGADRQAFFRGQAPPQELSLHGPTQERLGEWLSDPGAVPADDLLANHQFRVMVAAETAKFERCLDRRSKAVFRTRLRADEPGSFAPLARRFSVTSERLRQIEKQVAAELRVRLAPLVADRA